VATPPCPACGTATPGEGPYCLQCGRPIGAGGGAPLPSALQESAQNAGSPFAEELFAHSSGIVFRASLDQPFLGSFQILDDQRRLIGFLRHAGQGLQGFLMNLVLEDSAHRPIYFLRPPDPRPGIHFGGEFSLVRPDGLAVGQLGLKPGLGKSSFSLSVEGIEPLTAVKPVWGWQGCSVQQGNHTVGTVRIQWPALPGGIFLDFVQPPTQPPSRSLIVALVAFMSTWNLARQFPRWPV